LLWSNNLCLSSDANLEPNLSVLKRNNLVSCVLLLNLKLINTFGIQTNVASEELESVLEVLLLLVHCSVSDKSLLICVGNDHSI
jgi:hypothetical protein